MVYAAFKRQTPLIFARPFYFRSTLYTAIVAVAKLPSTKLLSRVKALISMGSVCWAAAACAAAATGVEIESARLDASDRVVEVEMLLADCPVAPAAGGAEKENEIEENENEDGATPTLAAPVCPAFAIGPVDSVAGLMAMVDRVVPASAGA